VWEENSYALTYLSNDGKSESVSSQYGYLSTNALAFINSWVRPGFNFLGWSTNPSALTPESSYSVTSNDNLYAVWEAIQYSITYESNDGLNNQIINSVAHEDTTALEFISGWSRVGFTFLGWSTTPDASTALSSYVVEGDDALYAVWQITIYTITFDRNPGASLDNQYNYGATNALTFSPGWTLDGFTFLGWSTDANANTAATAFTVTGNETLFAIWALAPAATFGPFPDLVKNLSIGKFTLVNPTTNSTGTITYQASCAGIVKVVGKVVTLVSAGNCVITATVAAAPNFGRASVSMNLRITPLVVVQKVFKLSRSVYFKGDSSVLTPTANSIMQEIFRILKGKKNIAISVKGWVKETPDKSYDISLSNRRAGNIVNYLRNLLGIKGKFTHRGFGISPENNYTSRRADITVTYTK
jgi:outer membrane protein OmpA-like peptidoglycan-associated protein